MKTAKVVIVTAFILAIAAAGIMRNGNTTIST